MEQCKAYRGFNYEPIITGEQEQQVGFQSRNKTSVKTTKGSINIKYILSITEIRIVIAVITIILCLANICFVHVLLEWTINFILHEPPRAQVRIQKQYCDKFPTWLPSLWHSFMVTDRVSVHSDFRDSEKMSQILFSRLTPPNIDTILFNLLQILCTSSLCQFSISHTPQFKIFPVRTEIRGDETLGKRLSIYY